MRYQHSLVILLVALIGSSFQSVADNDVDTDEPNPLGDLADIAKSIMKEQDAQNIAQNLVQAVMPNTVEAIGKIASKLSKANSAQLMEGLVSAWMNNQNSDKTEDGKGQPDLMGVVENVGNLISAFKGKGSKTGGGGGFDAGMLLQGLGSLLGNQQGAGGGGSGFDPNVIGTLFSAFSNMQGSGKPKKHKKVPKSVETNSVSEETEDDDNVDLSGLLSLASSFMGQEGGKNSKQNNPLAGMLKFMPMVLETINSFAGSEAREREHRHSEHSDQLPPVLERVHIAFDHFIHSEIGKQVISSMGAEKAFDFFRDKNGTFDYQKFSEMMENKSFRRHWLKIVVDRLINFLQLMTQPEIYKQYFITAQLFANSYLRSQGFPKATLFDPQRPVETISAFVNYAAKKYFDIKIKSKEYVQPVVEYIKELLVLSEKKGPLGDEYKEVGSKLADTLNSEIIEPLAKVNRAYRFAKSVPKCTRYVLCLVNQEDINEVNSLPAIRKVLYRGASYVAGWYLSTPSEVPFWTLYSDISDSPNCKSLYQKECDGYHEEELKVTTEYVHTEL